MCVKNKLQEIRWDKKLTQEQLHIKSGVKKSIINNLEQDNQTTTSFSNAVKLAKALDVPISELFPD